MSTTFEIYFHDLVPEVRGKLLKEFETTEGDENWETVPLVLIEREIED